MSNFQSGTQVKNCEEGKAMAIVEKPSKPNHAEFLIPQNGSKYYEYLRDIKNGEFYNASDYLTIFTAF